MSSFLPVVQARSASGASSLAFLSNTTAGNILLAYWGSNGASGTPTPPSTVTDDNGNVYKLASTGYEGNGCANLLFVAVAAGITPNNPITITFNGASNIVSGGPNIIIAELPAPSTYQVFGSNVDTNPASGDPTPITFDVTQVNGLTTGSQELDFTIGYVFGTLRVVGLILINEFTDAVVIGGAHSADDSGLFSSGTTIALQTQASVQQDMLAYLSAAPFIEGCGFVSPTLAITCSSPPQGTVGMAYSHQFGPATGGTPPYTYSLTGSVPGLTFSDSTGIISGTPTTPGTYILTVGVTDAASGTASVMCSIVIVSPTTPTALCNNPPGGLVGVAYLHQFGASGGTPPYTFAIIAGSLPPGLTMNAAGLVTGTPTTAGSYMFTVQVTDSLGATGTVSCTITIGTTPPNPTDTQFFLTHVVVGLKPARLPIRGSAT